MGFGRVVGLVVVLEMEVVYGEELVGVRGVGCCFMLIRWIGKLVIVYVSWNIDMFGSVVLDWFFLVVSLFVCVLVFLFWGW